MKNTRIYAIAFMMFACAIGYLCYAGFSENSIYFLNVSEAMAKDSLGKARLFGLVSENGMNRSFNEVKFNLADKDNDKLFIPVSYVGVIPDTFKPGAEVIVEGGMENDGSFLARNLMTKCPSRYLKENREKQLP